jgi:NAD(P)H-hydrate epimerase
MILTGAQMKALEERAFADGVSAEALMEEAGKKIAQAVAEFCPGVGKCVVFFGKGHNGGDALVAARYLSARSWSIELRPAFPREVWSDLTKKKHAQLEESAREFEETRWLRQKPGALVILDGLLGIGAGGALREPIRSAAREINRSRVANHAHVFALDLPTGLDTDTGESDADAVVADYTLAIGFAKRGLVADAATKFVGRLAVLPLHELTTRASGEAGEVVATAESLAPLLPRRCFDLHKGDCGRVGIVAGSRGLTGAARLAAEACVRAGAGLITLFVTEDIYPILAASAAAEVMVRPVKSYLEVLDAKLDVLAVGPGLGQGRANEIRQLLDHAPQPTVIDADALNILAGHLHHLDRSPGPRLLTPHPGEMARLESGADLQSALVGRGQTSSPPHSRRTTVEAFTSRWPHTLLLKGARTIIGQRGQPLSYNTTGSPGMATGGMGDILTGVCAALAAQKISLYDAARLGAWLCGRAAELALVSGRESEESLAPTALLTHLGPAFRELHARCW